MPKRSEDSILLAKFVSENDQDAFAQIVRKYESLVWNVCCRVLHNRHDAEDAFQQTFLLLASKARRIRKPRSLSSWLYGVAFRVASSIRRQRQRDMLPYETSVDPRLTDNVLEYVARKNENELVSAEIMLMKEKHKRPLLMFYFMGDSTAQIADTLGITVSAVEGRLRQARQALRSQLILRGIDFETTFAALLLPVLSLSPSLTVATTNKIAAASMSGFAGIIHSYLTGYNQTGAKLMLSKIAVSFSIACIAAAGIMHHSAISQEDGKVVTEVQNAKANHSEPTVRLVKANDKKKISDWFNISDQLYDLTTHLQFDWKTWTFFSRDKPVDEDAYRVVVPYSENLDVTRNDAEDDKPVDEVENRVTLLGYIKPVDEVKFELQIDSGVDYSHFFENTNEIGRFTILPYSQNLDATGNDAEYDTPEPQMPWVADLTWNFESFSDGDGLTDGDGFSDDDK